MNTKILKRALEMAVKYIFSQTQMGNLGQSCIGCPVKQPCFTDKQPCAPVIFDHFLHKATAEIKAKEEECPLKKRYSKKR